MKLFELLAVRRRDSSAAVQDLFPVLLVPLSLFMDCLHSWVYLSLVAVIVGVVMTVGGGLFMILVALIAAMVKNPAKVYNAYQMQERRQQAEPVAYTVGQDGTKRNKSRLFQETITQSN